MRATLDQIVFKIGAQAFNSPSKLIIPLSDTNDIINSLKSLNRAANLLEGIVMSVVVSSTGILSG